MRKLANTVFGLAVFYCVAGGFALLWQGTSPNPQMHVAGLCMVGTGICAALYMVLFQFAVEE
jgi:hypothetical protein